MVLELMARIDLLQRLKDEMLKDMTFFEAKGTVAGTDAAYGVLCCLNKLGMEITNLEAEVDRYVAEDTRREQRELAIRAELGITPQTPWDDPIYEEYLDKKLEADLDDMHLAMEDERPDWTERDRYLESLIEEEEVE